MKRFYVRVSPFSLGKVLMALLNDDNVSEVCVSLEDNDLLVSFSERPKDRNIEKDNVVYPKEYNPPFTPN